LKELPAVHLWPLVIVTLHGVSASDVVPLERSDLGSIANVASGPTPGEGSCILGGLVTAQSSAYGGTPGLLITVEDPDEPDIVLRLVPETGNTGTGGGAYLLLDACPGCSGDPRSRGDVPVVAISGLADLGHYQHCLRLNLDAPPVPVEFIDDPAHAPDCALR
jgi:hypothetical protein